MKNVHNCLAIFLLVYAENSFATGIGLPDLGTFGNILFYGGLFLVTFVLPIIAVIVAIYLVIRAFSKGGNNKDDNENS